MLAAVIMGWEQPRRSFLSNRRCIRRLLLASFRRMLGFTRNPSRRLVLEKADTSFNTGNAEGFRVSPNNHPTKAGDFACLRASVFWRASINEVTRILSDLANGDAHAAGQLLPLVYEELRKLAAARMAEEAPGNTLNATALVREAYLRLVGPAHDARWENRGHFFSSAAEAMRRIL